MKHPKLARVALLVLFVCLSLVLGAGWSGDPEPVTFDEMLKMGIPGIMVDHQAPPYNELSSDEQEAIVQEAMANLWRYQSNPEAPMPETRAVDAQNGLIAFVDDKGHLAHMNPDGSGVTVLNSAIENANSPRWSADETRIVFVGDKQEGGRCIYILRHGDRQVTTVTCEPAIIHDPNWSPDGLTITFAGYMKESDLDRRGWIVPAAGGSLKEIAPALQNIWTPSWLDKNTVIFSGENPADNWRIYRADISKLTEPKAITPPFTCHCTPESVVAAHPVPSPDHQWIAFIAGRTVTGKWDSDAVGAVYIVDPMGARPPSKLGDVVDTTSGLGLYSYLHWAPDNQQIGILASGSDQKMRLNLLRVGSEDVETLRSREGGGWSNWSWSPDGRIITMGNQRPELEWEVNTLYVGSDSFQRLMLGHSPAWRKSTETACQGTDLSRRPIMFVTGWGGSWERGHTALSQDEQLHHFLDYLGPKGYRDGCNLFYATGTTPHRSLHDNGYIVYDSICTAYNTYIKLKPDWDGSFDMIGYSYGGLRARYFLENNIIYNGGEGANCSGNTVRVENLITVGTPHGGEPFRISLPNETESLLPFAFFIGVCEGGLDLCNLIKGEWNPELIALNEMLPQNRATENIRHKQPVGTCYHLLSGDARSQIFKVPSYLQGFLAASIAVDWTANDFAVHRASAHILGGNNYPAVNKISSQDVHGYVPETEWWSGPHDLISFVEPIDTFNNVIWPLLQQPCDDSRMDQARRGDIDLAREKDQLRQMTATNAPPQRDVLIAALERGKPVMGQFTVTEAGESHLTAFWGSGDLAFSLTDPVGNVIAPEAPGVAYFEMNMGFGQMADYALTDMTPGQWQYSLTISNVEQVTPVRLLYQSERKIGASLTTPQWMTAGEPLPLSVAVMYNDAPLAGGSVVARIYPPDNSQVTLTLLDDGAHDDGAAGDGVFGGVYPLPNAGGFYDIVITATGEADFVAYERTTSTTVSVAPRVSLTGNYRDSGLDSEKDGLFEFLVFESEMEVGQAGLYLVKAELWGGGGLIAEMEYTYDLRTGKQWVPVYFYGPDIRRSGQDGSYQVRNLLLIEASGASILIDAVDEVHQTGPYDHREFGTHFRTFFPFVNKSR